MPRHILPEAARLRFRHLLRAEIDGIAVLLHRAGYTETDERYEIYVHPDHAQTVWENVLDAGKDLDVRPAGLGTRKALHAEAGLPSWERGARSINGIDLIRGRFADWVRMSKHYFVGLEPIPRTRFLPR